MHPDAMLMRSPAMPMHPDAMLMRRPAMPMHPDAMLMRSPAMPMYPDTMLMRSSALKTLGFYRAIRAEKAPKFIYGLQNYLLLTLRLRSVLTFDFPIRVASRREGADHAIR